MTNPTECAPTPIFPDLAGKVAVVTGGSKGIGAATCRALAENGAKVAVVARERGSIDRLVDELRAAGADAIGATADCTSLAEIEQMRDEVESSLGPTDIVAAFAGGFGARTPILETTEEEWHFVIDSNLTATFLTTKAFLPGMIERRRGSIVTMASNAARYLDIPLTASYAAAKAGIVMFTRHVAKEAGPYHVRLNCVAPATTMSERAQALMDEQMIARITALSPLDEIGQPVDTAYMTLFLASDVARWLTGITVDIAGGRVML